VRAQEDPWAGAPEPGGVISAAPDPEEERERAREYVLRALTASAKSRSRLAQGLADRDVDPEIADEVLDRFEEVGLIDDVQYAQTLVRTRFAERGLSRRALAAELRTKGIDETVAREALDQVDDARPDVAIVDIRMPIVDGFELSRRLLERRPDLPIALLTSMVDEVIEEKAEAAGARLVADKADFDALPDLVRRLAAV